MLNIVNYVHIGLPKCGSTSLHRFMYVNHEDIAQQGIFTLCDLPLTSAFAALNDKEIALRFSKNTSPDYETAISVINQTKLRVSEINKNGQSVFFSTEYSFCLDDKSISLLMDCFNTPDIIICHRNEIDVINSLTYEVSKKTDDYIEIVERNRHLFDMDHIFKRWSQRSIIHSVDARENVIPSVLGAMGLNKNHWHLQDYEQRYNVSPPERVIKKIQRNRHQIKLFCQENGVNLGDYIQNMQDIYSNMDAIRAHG